MNFKNIGFGLAATATLTAGTVLAANPAKALTFDFSGDGGRLDFLDVTEGGITVRANEIPTSRDLFQHSLGIGVKGSSGDNSQFDGAGPNESIILAFSEEVNLGSAKFSAVGQDDDFDLFVADSLAGLFNSSNRVLNEVFPPGTGNNVAVSFASVDTTAQYFRFLADGTTDDLFLTSVHVEPTTPIPTPVLLPGLLSMFAALRKKRKR